MVSLRKNQSGSTLSEFVVYTVTVILISSYVAPSLSSLGGSFSRGAAISQFSSDVSRARAETLRAGARGVLAVAQDGRSYSFGLDYEPYSQTPQADSIMFQSELPGDITVVASDVMFDSRGYAINSSGVPVNIDFSMESNDSEFIDGKILSLGGFCYGDGCYGILF